jgi:hypothetical protein
MRLLGRDQVKKLTLRHIAVLQKNLRARQNITSDRQKVIMTLSITYAQFRAAIDQKIEQGQIQGRLSAQPEIARELRSINCLN